MSDEKLAAESFEGAVGGTEGVTADFSSSPSLLTGLRYLRIGMWETWTCYVFEKKKKGRLPVCLTHKEVARS